MTHNQAGAAISPTRDPARGAPRMAAAAVRALLGRVRGAGDALFALGVLAVVLLLVAPLTPGALDVLLALNLAAAATVLVVTLFARDALRFASFPTLLLLTTLLRLALNVSSTRLVLSRGDAGRVIEAFGEVVVQGNAVIGAVIFAILALVQVLVVTKGAERVAEVAARFALDAMPGKQMAIDADARAGAIDAVEARRRRRALERESQLHGAMDGALKFVKGDAIAGIAIVGVNVVGGLVAGSLRGMDLASAARRYTLLAIGDGLVSQIPALLVAIAAGVAVTRVAAEEEGGSIGGEIGRQLLAEPGALAAVSALLCGLALAPGLPALPFLTLAAAAGLGAYRIARSRAPSEPAPPPGARDGAADAPFASPAPIALLLGDDLHSEARAEQGRSVRERLGAIRERLWADLGIRIPPITVSGSGGAGEWTLLVDGVPAAAGRADAGEAVALVAPDDLALVGIDGLPHRDPLTGRAASLVSAQDAARAGALGPVRGPLDRVLAEVTWALSRTAYLFVGVQETQGLLDRLEATAPALVREATRQLPPALLAEVLRRLVEERVSILPLHTILEALLEAGGASRGAPALAEAARRALRRQIGHRCAGEGPLAALLIDPGAERVLRDALAGEALALHPDLAARLMEALDREVGASDAPPVILAAGDVRRALRGMVATRFPRVAVLSFDDVPPELPVRPVGRLSLVA
jgi:type III secretion protein V